MNRLWVNIGKYTRYTTAKSRYSLNDNRKLEPDDRFKLNWTYDVLLAVF